MIRHLFLIAAFCCLSYIMTAHEGFNSTGQNEWFEDPGTERYFISQTGRNIKQGSGYYQNVLVLFNSAHYGITDWFSLGLGFEAISTFSGNPIFMVLPKLGFEISENVSFGAGVHYINASVLASEAHGGIAYGVVTRDFGRSNISFGAGWAFLQDEFSSQPVLNLSGMTRLTRRLGLVTENWLFLSDENSYALFSYGVRFLGENATFDLGLVNSKDIAKTFPVGFPAMASFCYYF